jgi:hypothetical protein
MYLCTIYLHNYWRDCFNPFKLFVVVQRSIGHGYTKHEEQNPISLENLINSFNLQKTTQELRRHRGYLARAKHARIWEYAAIQLQSDHMCWWIVLWRTTCQNNDEEGHTASASKNHKWTLSDHCKQFQHYRSNFLIDCKWTFIC